MNTASALPPAPTSPENLPETPGQSWRQLSPQQWKSGLAAWLGWTFDGLDMHLYTLVSAPFVRELLQAQDSKDPRIGHYGSIIQAAFLLGWAVGGGFFGRLGDRLGRSRALCLTVLTYALFTGFAAFAQTWWQLMIVRFIAALGIGGEWAVGASLIAETWPRRWRPWLAAILQSGVNVGVLIACLANVVLAGQPPRYLFLVGVLPAFLVFWIRRAVPEPEEWHAAQAQAKAQAGNGGAQPAIADLFRGPTRRITLQVIAVCAVSLTAHWAFMFWHQQQLRKLPEVLLMTDSEQNRLASQALYVLMVASIIGNFFAAWLARRLGYRATIVWMCLGYFAVMTGTYGVVRDHQSLLHWLPAIGFFQGLFGLFTMYLPPLFPTLLRTTGAGFCYNIGRIAAAFGTVFFGMFSKVSDHRLALLGAGLLFLPAGLLALRLPHARD